MNTSKRQGDDSALDKVDPGRRAFIRKLAAGTAFAIPMVASFSTDGLSFNKAEAFGFDSNQTKDGGLLSKILRFVFSFFKFGKTPI